MNRSMFSSRSLLVFGLVGILSGRSIHYVIGFGEPSGTKNLLARSARV